MRVVSFKLEEEWVEIIEQVARQRNITKSELIRRALRKYIGEGEDKPFVTRREIVY